VRKALLENFAEGTAALQNTLFVMGGSGSQQLRQYERDLPLADGQGLPFG
jgi:hypothetical protein